MQSVNVSGGAATKAIISGLTCGTTYAIEVAAVNSAGIGKYSLSMAAITSSKSVWYQPVSLDWVHSVAICTLYIVIYIVIDFASNTRHIAKSNQAVFTKINEFYFADLG